MPVKKKRKAAAGAAAAQDEAGLKKCKLGRYRRGGPGRPLVALSTPQNKIKAFFVNKFRSLKHLEAFR